MRMSAFDSGPESGPFSQDVLLPHQLIERPRAHPDGQGCVSSYLVKTRWGVFVE